MADEARTVVSHPESGLSKEQVAGLLFVIFCGLGSLGLGGLYLWKHMAAPFTISYTGPRLLTGDAEVSAVEAAEKTTDTDGDGVSDYDEKRIYGSSPYISDTDGDGLMDGVEITTGGDPNCAKGEVCNNPLEDANALNNAGAGGTFVDNLEEPVMPDDTQSELAADGQLTAEDFDSLKSLSTAEIRELLLQSGADPVKIAAMSEEEMRQIYYEILDSFSTSLEAESVPKAE